MESENLNSSNDPDQNAKMKSENRINLNDVLAREKLKETIENFVDTEIRPFLHSDGGDLEIIELQSSGILRVMLQGACQSCVSSIMTLKFGVERRLMEVFPEIIGIELAGLGSINYNEAGASEDSV